MINQRKIFGIKKPIDSFNRVKALTPERFVPYGLYVIRETVESVKDGSHARATFGFVVRGGGSSKWVWAFNRGYFGELVVRDDKMQINAGPWDFGGINPKYATSSALQPGPIAKIWTKDKVKEKGKPRSIHLHSEPG